MKEHFARLLAMAKPFMKKDSTILLFCCILSVIIGYILPSETLSRSAMRLLGVFFA